MAVGETSNSSPPFQLLFQRNPLPMWVYDRETLRFLEVNKAAVACYGYSRAEFLTMRITDLRPEAEQERLMEDLQQERPAWQQSGVWTHQRRDGATLQVQIASHTLTFEGRPAVLVVAHDVTERQAAEQALRESELRYRTLVEQSHDAIYIYRGRRLLFVNQRTCALTGYDEETLYAMDVFELVHPDDRARIQEIARKRAAAGEDAPTRYEARLVRADGTVRHGEFSVQPITYQGEYAAIGSIRDVTERVEAEQALRDSREQLRVTLNSIGDAVIATDTDGRITQMNPIAEQLTDWTEDEAAGRPLTEVFTIVNAKTGDSVENPAGKVLAEGKTVGLANHTVLIARDGTRYQIADSAAPIRTDEGTLMGVVMVFRDVTEAYHRREALRRSEERFRAVSEQAADIIAIVDEEGRNRYMSPSYEDVLGYRREEMLGTRAFERVHPEDRSEARAKLRKALEDPDTAVSILLRARHRDGTWRHLSVVGTQLKSSADARHVLLIARDVTDQQAAEAQLRRTMQRLRILHAIGRSILAAKTIDAIAQATLTQVRDIIPFDRASIMTFDPAAGEATIVAAQSNTDTQFETGRRIDLDALRLAPDDTLHGGRHVRQLTADDDSPVSRQLWEEGIRSHLSLPLRAGDEVIGRMNVGATTPDVFTDEQADAAREVADMVALAMQQARYEVELVQAKERAEEMNRLKSAFLANMSHEIRTPLTAIIGFSEVLAEQETGSANELVDLIRRGGQRLLETLNSVLDLSQLEAGSMRLSPTPTDVRDEVREAATLFAAQARRKEVTLDVDVPDAPVFMTLDASALRRVLNNLISNAVKFAGAGDRVTVSVQPGPQQVAFIVADTGIGIDTDFLPYLFEAFHQESSGSGRTFEGSGLGLAITRQLVELMGGTIAVETEKGAGTRFIVRLPHAATEDTA